MLIHFGLHDARKIGQSWPAAVNLVLSSANRLLHTPSRCFSFRLMELLQTISLPKRKHQHSWKLEGLISITEARCQEHQQQFINKNPWTEIAFCFTLFKKKTTTKQNKNFLNLFFTFPLENTDFSISDFISISSVYIWRRHVNCSPQNRGPVLKQKRFLPLIVLNHHARKRGRYFKERPVSNALLFVLVAPNTFSRISHYTQI